VKPIRASAPGKLIVSGEYAVLDGAAAISMAVDRRAIVSVASREGDCHAVTSPGFSESEGLFTGGSGELTWHGGGEDYQLFEKVWIAADISSPEALSFTLDTRPFRERGVKTGVGSSAALAVALATVIAAIGGGDSHRIAKRAHREFQGGTGSGVDIASSLAGGVIEYRLSENAGQELAWPAGLHHAVFWSGVGADTRSKLEQLQKQPVTASRAGLGDAANRFAAVFRGGSAPRVLDELDHYKDALRRFDADCELGIFDAGHAHLADAASGHGVVYKPCGAGGGDVGIALAAAEDSLASFTEFARSCGFRRLAMNLDSQGAMLIEEEQ
jgi:phosphomevalonate kinase